MTPATLSLVPFGLPFGFREVANKTEQFVQVLCFKLKNKFRLLEGTECQLMLLGDNLSRDSGL